MFDPAADRIDEYLHRLVEEEREREELELLRERNQQLWQQHHPAQLRWTRVGGEYRLEVRR